MTTSRAKNVEARTEHGTWKRGTCPMFCPSFLRF